ncbi:formylglycine-generating enzyme family protein, partial [Rhodovulum sulfidophilum]|uniref:formylglycine-generating enzyme family protein n=1 Tax=Rhodovulum sulfidophilum TaxID=35806 RepID=UPI001389B572
RLLGTVTSGDGLIRVDTDTPFRDRLADGAPGPEMIAIPTGTFLMGSAADDKQAYNDEKPGHPVDIAEPFALAKYPLTFEEFDRFCEVTGREKPDDRGWGRGRRPAINVSWEDAAAYCDWLSDETGEAYRLPSEAEWEYACRAGTTTRYWWGDDWEASRANGADGSSGKTTEVGTYDPNEWGLHDMHGNVDEWCQDHWSGNYEEPRSQAAFQSSSGGPSRVIRGGSWLNYARSCRSAFRGRVAPDYRYDILGFRPARGQAPGAQTGRQGTAERSGLRADETGKAEPPVERREGTPSQGDGESDFSRTEPVRCRVMPGRSTSIPLAKLPPAPFVIRTDRAELVIQRITRSDLGSWASGMGRDRFGLWAEFALGDIRQRLRFCPPGRFLMGSPSDEAGYVAMQDAIVSYKGAEEPQTEITFKHGFWLFDTPVTVAQWRAFMGTGAHKMKPGAYVWNGKEWAFDEKRGWDDPGFEQSEDAPVTCVGWEDACSYLGWLNDRLDGIGLRLPSEAEWEYACRAGSQTPFVPSVARAFAGSDIGTDEVNYDGNYPIGEAPTGNWRQGTVPVKGGPFRPNGWGVWHMHGNVFEWCEDEWHGSHEGASPDGRPWHASQQEGETSRVIRGGSWLGLARRCRSAYRFGLAPVGRGADLGFRPARGQVPGVLAGRQGTAERSGLRAGAAGKAEPPAERREDPPRQGRGGSFFSRARNALGLGRKED